MKYVPHGYQAYATERIITQTACGLFLEMGMGKTAATLTAVAELLHDRFDVARVLVIAPLRVAGRDGLDGRQLRGRLLALARLRHGTRNDGRLFDPRGS